MKAAVVNYDAEFLQRDSKWGEHSLFQKMYFLFETVRD